MTVSVLQRLSSVARPGRHRGGVAVVSLRGELDVLDARALEECLQDIRWQGAPRSVIDLTALAFIDCACLGVLARGALEIRRRGGTLALAGPQGTVRRLLSVTALLTWFEIYDTVDEAAGGHGRRTLIFPDTAQPGPPRAAPAPAWHSRTRGPGAVRRKAGVTTAAGPAPGPP